MFCQIFGIQGSVEACRGKGAFQPMRKDKKDISRQRQKPISRWTQLPLKRNKNVTTVNCYLQTYLYYSLRIHKPKAKTKANYKKMSVVFVNLRIKQYIKMCEWERERERREREERRRISGH